MVFVDSFFLFAFLPVVLLGNFILQKSVLMQNIFLVLMSLLFYGWSAPKLLLLITSSIVINYSTALMIEKTENRNIRLLSVFLGILSNIGILFYFKYAGWFCEILKKLFKSEIGVVEIVLPLGISFYTFQAMSYIIDVYRKKVRAQKNFLIVALYILMFPQLVAGPIVRYSEIELQICVVRKFIAEEFSVGVERYIKGFSKKILLADTFAVIADKAFSLNAQGELETAMAWLGAIAYALQIYYDFSGYSDMAIGLGKMLGFKYPENFDYPYYAVSITDFWRRWHMTLGAWFREYVYIPLGGNRKERPRTMVNLAITWLATGLWHGANLTYVLWGGYYGALLITEKTFRIPERIHCKKVLGWLYRIITIVLIISGWVLFRADNMMEAFHYWGIMFGFKVTTVTADIALLYLHTFRVELLFGLLFSVPIVPRLISFKPKYLKVVNDVIMMFLFLISISYVMKGSYCPFIYFNF